MNRIRVTRGGKTVMALNTEVTSIKSGIPRQSNFKFKVILAINIILCDL